MAVTWEDSRNQDSSLLNYSDYYDSWDDDEEVEQCSDCYGTGLDRDEIYDCMTCGGEGEIHFIPSKVSLEIALTSEPAT